MKLVSKKPLSILIIGGCHTTGYPLGNSKSFSQQFSDLLNTKQVEHTLEVKPYFTLDKPAKLKSVLEELCPDIIVLQCGHFEFSVASLPRKLRLKKAKSAAAAQSASAATPATIEDFVPSLKFRTVLFFKHLANLFTGYSSLNRSKWENKIKKYFSAIDSHNPQEVFVLQPFISQNRITNKYREIGAKLLSKQSKAFSFHYIDGINEEIRKKSGPWFTVDENHLNETAHLAVANKLLKHALPYLNTSLSLPVDFAVNKVA